MQGMHCCCKHDTTATRTANKAVNMSAGVLETNDHLTAGKLGKLEALSSASSLAAGTDRA